MKISAVHDISHSLVSCLDFPTNACNNYLPSQSVTPKLLAVLPSVFTVLVMDHVRDSLLRRVFDGDSLHLVPIVVSSATPIALMTPAPDLMQIYFPI